MAQKWKDAQSKDYVLTKENVQELFEYLEKQHKLLKKSLHCGKLYLVHSTSSHNGETYVY